MSIKIISAVGQNLEIGKKGDLCFHIKEDMKFFRETTEGASVLMGYRTYLSMNSKPLKNRTNYVANFDAEGISAPAILTTDPEALLKSHVDDAEPFFAIGGASIYKLALPYADEIYLTEIDATDPEADTFFPSFDKSLYDKTILRKGKENDLTYSFVVYKRK